MKKMIAVCIACCLSATLAACGQKPLQQTSTDTAGETSQAASTSAPAASSGTQNQTTLQMNIEGERTDIPATLYSGDGYSIYIPDEGWNMDEPGEWEAAKNTEVELKVKSFSGKTAEDARSVILADYEDYGFMDPDEEGHFFGTDGEDQKTMDVYLTETGTGTFVVLCSYPDEAAEGFGAQMKVIAKSLSTN